MKRVVLLGLTALSLAVPSRAQDTPASIKAAELDLSVPASPAFAVLGLTPETVLRPASPRALATSLLNGIDPNGTVQNGIAIDAAPYFLAYGRRITLQQYTDHYLTRFFSRLQLSVATAKAGSENDKATRLSAGLRLTFFDKGDYRGNRNLRTDLSGAREEARLELEALGIRRSINEDAALAYNMKLDEALAAKATEIRERYRKKAWNDSAFVIGVAPTWRSDTGDTSRLTSTGGVVWASLSYGFEGLPGLEDSSQIIVHVRHRRRDRLPDAEHAGEFLLQNSSLGGVRFRFGSPDTNGSLESVFLRTDPDGAPADRYFRLTGEAEHRLFQNVWLQFSVGGETGRRNNQNRLFVLSNFKFAFDRREMQK